MQKAIVLVNLVPGADEQAVASLKGLAGVVEVYQTYGLYDVLMIVEGADEQEIKSTITGKLRQNPSIASTITMKVVT
ncbi:MAG TPA: Lrp/AsnC ligand binding domain-containing protein [Nitrososphaerales archaeon]|nr:Lrp/AsnC ligand binding domain-containing protein [Nitrososphaerales archaeon]